MDTVEIAEIIIDYSDETLSKMDDISSEWAILVADAEDVVHWANHPITQHNIGHVQNMDDRSSTQFWDQLHSMDEESKFTLIMLGIQESDLC